MMASIGMISPYVLAPFMFYQAIYLNSVWKFREGEGSPSSAKMLKRKSYMPFLVLLGGFMISTAY